MSYEYDPCVTRIPLKQLHELRGRVEHWSNCNSALGAEMRFIDKMLVSRSGMSTPKGHKREIKQAFIDFWTSVETIRAHMATDDYWSQSYNADFIGALSLDEQLSSPDAWDRLVWVGSDATMTQCAAVDYAYRVCTVFSFAFCLNFLSMLPGLPVGYFTLIAIAEFLSFVCFSVSFTDLYGEIDFVCG